MKNTQTKQPYFTLNSFFNSEYTARAEDFTESSLDKEKALVQAGTFQTEQPRKLSF
jgi:hypothetical protein